MKEEQVQGPRGGNVCGCLRNNTVQGDRRRVKGWQAEVTKRKQGFVGLGKDFSFLF